MTLSVDWSTTPFRITCPKSDLSLISGTKYQITVDYLWQLLREFADGEEAIPQPVIYVNTPPTASTPRIIEVNDDYYDWQFENGNYSVEIINGNSNIRDVEVKNNVSVGTNNTTGFINPTFLETGLFDGGVTIDVAGGVSGTGKTSAGAVIGTNQTPSNNFADGLTIAQARGFRTFFIKTSAELSSGNYSDGNRFIGHSCISVGITLNSGVNLYNCEFVDLQVAGTLDGNSVFRECIVGTVDYINGFIYNCTLSGTVTLDGGANASIQGCWQRQGGTVPTIDMGGSGQQLALSEYKGEVLITNGTGAGTNYISGDGKIVLDSTVTSGTYIVYGDFEIENNGTATVINKTSHELTWDHIIEGTYTAEQVMQVMVAALAGKSSGHESGTPKYRDLGDTKDVIDAATDVNGNRSSVTVNP